jgi:hypothetical protein
MTSHDKPISGSMFGNIIYRWKLGLNIYMDLAVALWGSSHGPRCDSILESCSILTPGGRWAGHKCLLPPGPTCEIGMRWVALFQWGN